MGSAIPAALAPPSSSQKTASPTFHVPSWSTDAPLAPVATGVPAAVRSNLTVASTDEVSFTESTLDVTAVASGLDAKALTEAVNCEPFCSSSTRLLLLVAVLKKSFQLVVISVTADAEPPGLAGAGGGETVMVVEATEGATEEELELLEAQADMAVGTSIRPSTGTVRPRRAVG